MDNPSLGWAEGYAPAGRAQTIGEIQPPADRSSASKRASLLRDLPPDARRRQVPPQGDFRAAALFSSRVRDPARRHDRRYRRQHGDVHYVGGAAGPSWPDRGRRTDARDRLPRPKCPAEPPPQRDADPRGRGSRRRRTGVRRLSRLQHHHPSGGRTPGQDYATVGAATVLSIPCRAGTRESSLRVAGEDHRRVRASDDRLPESRLRRGRVRNLPKPRPEALESHSADRHGIPRTSTRPATRRTRVAARIPRFRGRGSQAVLRLPFHEVRRDLGPASAVKSVAIGTQAGRRVPLLRRSSESPAMPALLLRSSGTP